MLAQVQFPFLSFENACCEKRRVLKKHKYPSTPSFYVLLYGHRFIKVKAFCSIWEISPECPPPVWKEAPLCPRSILWWGWCCAGDGGFLSRCCEWLWAEGASPSGLVVFTTTAEGSPSGNSSGLSARYCFFFFFLKNLTFRYWAHTQNNKIEKTNDNMVILFLCVCLSYNS